MLTALRRHCDGGYVLACDRCLKAVNRKVNYTTARQHCTDMQGHLVMAKSSRELNCLRSFARTKKLHRTWVGADDMEEAGVFRWTDGTLLPDNSSLWTESEPEPDHTNPGGDTVYFFSYEFAGLFDRLYWDTHQFMCQKDIMQIGN
ncbi:hypothetical protein ACOMHN_012558 [Nucella lapillus]